MRNLICSGGRLRKWYTLNHNYRSSVVTTRAVPIRRFVETQLCGMCESSRVDSGELEKLAEAGD